MAGVGPAPRRPPTRPTPTSSPLLDEVSLPDVVGCGVNQPAPDSWAPARAATAAQDALKAARCAGGDEAAAVAAWMQHARINISVRDVYQSHAAQPAAAFEPGRRHS